MGQVIGDVLPSALGVAISPVPIIAVILMLLAPRARAASVAYLIGWVVGVTTVVVIVTLVVDPVDSSEPDDPSTFSSVLKLVLGALFLLLALGSWRSRPRAGQEPEMPSWMAAVADLNATKALGLGLLLSAVNPKNLAMCIAGGAAIGGGARARPRRSWRSSCSSSSPRPASRYRSSDTSWRRSGCASRSMSSGSG